MPALRLRAASARALALLLLKRGAHERLELGEMLPGEEVFARRRRVQLARSEDARVLVDAVDEELQHAIRVAAFGAQLGFVDRADPRRERAVQHAAAHRRGEGVARLPALARAHLGFEPLDQRCRVRGLDALRAQQLRRLARHVFEVARPGLGLILLEELIDRARRCG